MLSTEPLANGSDSHLLLHAAFSYIETTLSGNYAANIVDIFYIIHRIWGTLNQDSDMFRLVCSVYSNDQIQLI